MMSSPSDVGGATAKSVLAMALPSWCWPWRDVVIESCW
jgi:hypothetical protein